MVELKYSVITDDFADKSAFFDEKMLEKIVLLRRYRSDCVTIYF